ncbi:tyrosine-protein phosphatase [Paenibacillus typhae]|uniref:Protein-tyrosine phosphatase n=1 Tax=Paenibacillus typhae TaxID=1174501 RepID=A0A1G9AY68_9BACL|nr:tyrosine-protein phosphatase [Paenibacillus typhae]SDK32202.1 protein-tyrosine phosphatase [Paenibacillus typhae]
MTTTTNYTVRLLQLDGAYNVRDIGGYGTTDGGVVQTGRLFRADGLHRLTERDQQSLLGRGVRTIIDLRHGDELLQKRNVFADSADVAYHNVSLINPATTMAADIRSLGDMYKNMLDQCGPQLSRVFELISQAEAEGVLFHCAAGKDRTGVVAGLLLDLAGVPVPSIVADYAETETNLLPLMEEFRAEMPEMMQGGAYDAFLGSAPENMELMLDHLHRVYGGAESYLLSVGLSKLQIDSLKKKLLEA